MNLNVSERFTRATINAINLKCARLTECQLYFLTYNRELDTLVTDTTKQYHSSLGG